MLRGDEVRGEEDGGAEGGEEGVWVRLRDQWDDAGGRGEGMDLPSSGVEVGVKVGRAPVQKGGG